MNKLGCKLTTYSISNSVRVFQQAPTGYLNEKRVDRRGCVIVDKERAPIIKQMFEKVAYDKWTGRKLYHWLKFDLNFRTPYGNKNLTLSNVHKILNTPFYYGEFEWPTKSGNWYTGKHEPIITKELFEQARAQLKRDRIVRSETKEFAFTKLIKCGLCGSGVSAEEKFKKIKSTGLTARYVYYGCSRSRDRNCKGGYLREEDLVDQLTKLINKIKFNQTGMQMKFEDELKRFNKFHRGVLGVSEEKEKYKDIDLKTYAKYILKEGSNEEKRELMACFESKISVTSKRLEINL